MNNKLYVPLLLSALLVGCNDSNDNSNTSAPEITPPESYTTTLNIVSANMWQNLYRDFNDTSSFEVAVKELQHANADIIFFQEATGITARMAERLGMHYYHGNNSVGSVGILSKHPIKNTIDAHNEYGGNIGAVLDVNGRDVIVFSNHLDYTRYITYDARGGNGITWQAHAGCLPITSQEDLDALNLQSYRPRQASYMLEQLSPYLENNAVIIFGGDLNEASGLDWTEDTANMYDRKGTVHDFMTHRRILDAGYTDSYRHLYPDPTTNMGATWPFHINDSWTQGASYVNECGRGLDDRDRIDFIYYNANAEDIELVDASLIGPRINTYFPGPHGEDDTYQWDEKHSGMHVDEHGEPTYEERDFVSDHLWYKATFTLSTPSYDSEQESLINHAQFKDITIAEGENDGINISFNLTNTDLWDDTLNYQIEVSGDNDLTAWLSHALNQRPNEHDLISIDVPETVLTTLDGSTKNNGLQIRYVAGNQRKHLAVFTILKEDIPRLTK
ncbi:endonuclease/exonuclease/phosphatase family protein [Vibrio sp. B1Z05]|uniref:endonuclease/exonuclease/phosphatase family protein n=1 Tax=Vibrio sp. B1Z05 TaxID=2654980 RepID=UPI00128D4A92|nr:endonuclease/exonuclease/phosphatase family protein [Vibrio sp. B1Z05]MPW36171.1 endonuclease [Vibrio sp. B1Z05]